MAGRGLLFSNSEGMSVETFDLQEMNSKIDRNQGINLLVVLQATPLSK